MIPPADDGPDALTICRLRQVMAVFTGLLVASTWPLWTPGTPFPDIPWFHWAVYVPPEPWDWLWLIALGILLGLQFVPASADGRRFRLLQGAMFLLATLLLPTDQHRCQPWVLQMLVGALLIALAPSSRRALVCLRIFTLSIYFWSAVSKFDAAFLVGHGQVLLDGLLSSIGLSGDLLAATTRQMLAASFPLSELAVVVLLILPRTRRYGVVAAIAMHTLLILALGPTGLDHEWGVLIWNVFFAAQTWLLFKQQVTLSAPEATTSDRRYRSSALAAGLLTLVACTLPGLSLLGMWDWWPSWAVYSSRPAVVLVSVDESNIDQLPESLQPFVGSPQPLSVWCPVNLDAWSFSTCWCPMYPQERYRLAVILAVSREFDAEVLVQIHSTPDRWTRLRQDIELDGRTLGQRMQTFWWNVWRRGVWPPRPLD